MHCKIHLQRKIILLVSITKGGHQCQDLICTGFAKTVQSTYSEWNGGEKENRFGVDSQCLFGKYYNGRAFHQDLAPHLMNFKRMLLAANVRTEQINRVTSRARISMLLKWTRKRTESSTNNEVHSDCLDIERLPK